jgi:hypothetical protein
MRTLTGPMPIAYHSCVTRLSAQVGKMRQITCKLCLDCCRDQLLGSRSQQIRQRVRHPVSTRKINNVGRFHGGVSHLAELLSHNNKSTRYAANLQTAQTPDPVIARNPIESTFATTRHRTKRSKGCLSREGMLHIMFKLRQCAEQNWRKLRGFDYLAKVITGVTFKDGIETTKPDQIVA